MGVAGCGRSNRDDNRRFPRNSIQRVHHHRAGRGGHRRYRIARRGRDRHDDGALDEDRRRRTLRRTAQRDGARPGDRLARGPAAGLPRGRARGRRDSSVHGRLRRGRNRLAAGRPGDRRTHRGSDRLRHVRRRHPPQPGQVLQVHRDLPHLRRSRNPLLRHRRAADGRLAARSEQQGVRRHVMV